MLNNDNSFEELSATLCEMSNSNTKQSIFSTTRARHIKNAVGIGDHQRELLENWILGILLADAHEQVFQALDIDAHDLRNEITNLFLLERISICTQ